MAIDLSTVLNAVESALPEDESDRYYFSENDSSFNHLDTVFYARNSNIEQLTSGLEMLGPYRLVLMQDIDEIARPMSVGHSNPGNCQPHLSVDNDDDCV